MKTNLYYQCMYIYIYTFFDNISIYFSDFSGKETYVDAYYDIYIARKAISTLQASRKNLHFTVNNLLSKPSRLEKWEDIRRKLQ